MEGQRGSPGMLPSSEYQNGMRPVTPTRDASSAAHHNGMSNGDSNGLVTKGSNRSGQTHGAPIIDTGSFSQLSNASSRSVSPHGYCAPCLGSLVGLSQPPKPALACVVVWEESNSLDWWDLWQLYRRRRDNGTDLHRVSSQGQGFSSDLPDYNNQLAYRTQVWLVMMFSEQCTLCSTGQTSSSMYGVLSDVAAVQFYLVFECMWEEHTMIWACGCDDCIGHDGAELTDARRWWQPETVAESTRGC